MTSRATATFENLSHEQATYEDPGAGPALSRIRLRRRFRGDLEGVSSAELLACQPAKDVFGYVGTDRFVGALAGREGSFVFQHGGAMENGSMRPFGYVVPGSATGALEGLRGEVTISVTSTGEHSVVIDVELPGMDGAQPGA